MRIIFSIDEVKAILVKSVDPTMATAGEIVVRFIGTHQNGTGTTDLSTEGNAISMDYVEVDCGELK